MAVELLDKKSGKFIRLLNPSEKSKKYVNEIKDGICLNNYGQRVKTKSGKDKRLTDLQRSYRIGYLQARKDSVAIFNKNRNTPNKAIKKNKQNYKDTLSQREIDLIKGIKIKSRY